MRWFCPESATPANMNGQRRPNRVDEHEPSGLGSHAVDREVDEEVDDASEASFPASDPPAWMGMRVGGPGSRRRATSLDAPSMRREPDDT